MSRYLQPGRLNVRTLAQENEPLKSSTPLVAFKRLVAETLDLQPMAQVEWEAVAELRPVTGAEEQVWLYLKAEATVPLACQRCMTAVAIPVDVDQKYRFVATEDIAMAEDDQSEEDLLVMEPQFDLLALIEDELLMALPLVPMHDVCPVSLVLRSSDLPDDETADAKPNPFLALQKLKKITN